MDLYYQSSYRVEYIGKRYKSSKRRVTWTFYRRAAATATGAREDKDKLANNSNNNNNDDIPIEVCLEWSLQSGKQRIFVNGILEYYTQRKNASLVEYQWELLPITITTTKTATSTTTTTTNNNKRIQQQEKQ